MKRHNDLKTLSWEHHDGLVSAFRLQQGIKKEVAPIILTAYTLHLWEHSLNHHFWQEEKILHASLQKSKDGRELGQQMIADHEQFNMMMKRFKANTIDLDTLSEFANNLSGHIRFEERFLFPFIENNCTEKELNQIGSFLRENHLPACPTWKPEFWKM